VHPLAVRRGVGESHEPLRVELPVDEPDGGHAREWVPATLKKDGRTAGRAVTRGAHSRMPMQSARARERPVGRERHRARSPALRAGCQRREAPRCREDGAGVHESFALMSQSERGAF
jgi:hypothetical protein